MIDAILDTSVLLAFALGEQHHVDEDVVLSGAAISAITLAEFRAVLRYKNVEVEDIDATLRDLNVKVLAFGAAEAELAGDLIPAAQHLHMGLADCACIATGIVVGVPVWTADRDWTKLDAGAEIKLIR